LVTRISHNLWRSPGLS